MKEFIERQLHNAFLWVPFIISFGAILYFALPFEPNIPYSLIISAIIIGIIVFLKPKSFINVILLFCFGFLYAGGFTKLIDTPQINHPLRNIEITGHIKNIDYTDEKPRMFLSVPANELNDDYTDKKSANIRLSLNETQIIPKIGDIVHAKITIFPPSGPEAPDTFDYARWSYFNKITATGYLNEYLDIKNTSSNNLNNLRDDIHKKTNSFLSDSLVLWYKNIIPKDEYNVWQNAGVGHIWSISGFHMTLVGGWLFLLFFGVFRLITQLTRKIPAKYPALIFSWLGLLFYLFLSGNDVATLRAFLMTSLVFIAFIFGRDVFSLRNVCLVFCIIFMINPHYIMQAGFQLSFAAIFGLVWFFEKRTYKKLSPLKHGLNTLKIATQTSIIATLFTTPFIIYNFNSLPIYGLLGNLVLLPIFSFAIMPLIIIGTISSLFGVSSPLIWSMDIYNWAFNIADRINNLPFSQIQFPQMPSIAFIFILIGILCLMFLKNDGDKFITKYFNKIIFIIFLSIGVGIAIFNTAKKPLFYITTDHELAGFVQDGNLEFSNARAANHYFAFDTWKNLNNEDTDTKNKKKKCINGVCKFNTEKWNLVYIQKFMPLYKNINELCHDNDLDYIVSYFKIDAPNCNAKILNNGFVIYESGKIKYTQSNRYWHNPH